MNTSRGSALSALNRFTFILVLLALIGWAAAAQALPTGAVIVGEIERMGVDNPADVWSSGWMVVGKDNVIIPRNLLVELPANRLTLQQLFVPTPGNPTSGAPAACQANGESGLAKVDRCNARVLGANVTIFANRMDSGHVIAGDVRLAKANESISGVVTYINYTDGYLRINGTPNPGPVDDNTGTMLRFNDPGPLNNPGFGRHTIQQGLGCLPGSLNCSADPRFTADEENYTLTFQTGFPVCIPSTANGVGDPNCPSTNRPAPVVAPPPLNTLNLGTPPGLFNFVSPQTVPGGTVANSQHFAPILLGDSLTAFGNIELIPDNVLGAQFFSAHTVQVFVDLATRDDPSQPDYTILREVGWDSPPFPAARIRLLFVGNSTLHGLTLQGGGAVTDPDTAVDIYASHYDQSNVAHNSPGDGIPIYSTAGFKKGPVAFGGVSGGMFQIHPGLQVELDPGILDKKALLDPCSSLSSAIDTAVTGGPPPPPLFLADVRANCQLTAVSPITSTLTGQPAVDEAYKFVAPIAKEGVAYTRHKQRNPGLASFDKNGNPTPNGQYLSPIPTTWAGYEDINIGLMQAPFSFSGVPWLLDRRVGPNGCIGPCEGTPQPLTPFPFEGFNPSAVALRPSKANAAVGVPQPDLGRIFQFWPFGAAHQLAWDNAALTALATTGLPPIAPVPNLAFLVTVLPPPPATGVTLTALPASPQNAGTPVVFQAAATGGSGTYEYQFSRTVGAVLTVVQSYSLNPTWVWDTTGVAAGTDNVQVDARSAGSVNPTEATAVVSYTIGSAAATGLTLTAAPAGPANGGDNVLFTAVASGGGTYEYEFLGRVAGAGPLSLAQAYGSSNTFLWNTTGIQSGTYEIQVYARRVGTAVPFEATQTITYVVNTPAAVTVSLTATPASPQIPGTLVTFNAAATGGGAYEYAFTGRQVGGTLTMSQSYSNVSSWTWNTAGVPPGDYEILVMARAAGSSTAFQADNSIIYTIGTPSIAVSLAANPASPQLPGTAVAFTAAATGGSGTYEYQFLGRQAGTATFNIVQAYSAGNTWNWTAVAGSWEIQVQARNVGSAAPFEALQTVTYNVTVAPATGVTLTATPASPQTAGTSITFTGTATGGTGTYEYQFLGRQVGAPTFGIAQPYGPSNTWTWTGVAGSWEIQVQARSVGSIAPFDASATITDIVN